MDLDLIVVGGGSGGVRAARTAAGFGARVALVEADRLGGTCVNVGCVPKKLLTYAAHFGDVVADATGYGWTFPEPTFDWPELIRRKNDEILRLNQHYRRLLEEAGVRVVTGRGRFTGPHTVDVGGEVLRAERVLVATGGHPVRPDVPGAKFGVVSDDLFQLAALPRRAVIAGGGYIGVEFAGILHGLGVDVTLLARDDRLLVSFDRDVSSHLAAQMTGRGIRIETNTEVRALTRRADGIGVAHDAGEIVSDLVLFAVGRRPNTAGLGLSDVGVALDSKGGVVVTDDDFRTTMPCIHAVGDVVGRAQLTPVALAEGMVFARRVYGGRAQQVSYRNVPTAVFGDPEVGVVGLTETEARHDHEVAIFKGSFRPMFHTMTGRRDRAFVKLVVDRPSDRVLGVHIVGPDAAEIVQGFAVAVNAGATKAVFDATIGLHPTLAEELVTLRTEAT